MPCRVCYTIGHKAGHGAPPLNPLDPTMQPKFQFQIVSGISLMGEQRVPYAGLTVETKGNACTIRLYPFNRIVRIHNTRHVQQLPSIPSAEALEEAWPKYLPTITHRLSEVKVHA